MYSCLFLKLTRRVDRDEVRKRMPAAIGMLRLKSRWSFEMGKKKRIHVSRWSVANRPSVHPLWKGAQWGEADRAVYKGYNAIN